MRQQELGGNISAPRRSLKKAPRFREILIDTLSAKVHSTEPVDRRNEVVGGSGLECGPCFGITASAQIENAQGDIRPH
jgi:hypothetical protein